MSLQYQNYDCHKFSIAIGRPIQEKLCIIENNAPAFTVNMDLDDFRGRFQPWVLIIAHLKQWHCADVFISLMFGSIWMM